ncbi:MAG: histidinol-phosphatase HisJ family protein [Ruminococcaceae bacterium]|nr:histidinol-phosphatase HisJ family protein [Oscillospiraceae bacterium]
MVFNLHTHTHRCNHATGTEKEYIEHAVSHGVKTLGFSDHAPYCFPDGYYSHFRMTKGDTSDYFNTLRSLKEEFAGKIDIFIGLEAEYYPAHFSDFLDFIKPYNPDYLILGQHFINNEYDGKYSYIPTDDESVLKKYVEQSIEALKTGKFTYMAHPDLINFTGNTDVYLREMKKLCICAKEMDIPLEINLLGLMDNRAYPKEIFFRLVAEMGNKVILGADAHKPENVYNENVISKAKDFIKKTGVTILESVKLRSVF